MTYPSTSVVWTPSVETLRPVRNVMSLLTNKTKYCIGILLLLCLSLTQASADTQIASDLLQNSDCNQWPRELAFGQKIVCSIESKHTQEYILKNLTQGEYAHLEVEQHGVDVTLDLTGPDKFEQFRNWPSDNQGFEFLSFQVPTDGDYHLVIAVEAGTVPDPQSTYSVTFSERKKPAPADVSRANAEVLYNEALASKELPRRIELFGRAVAEWRKSGDDYGLATGLTSWSFARGSTQEVFTNQAELLKTNVETIELWKKFGQRQREIQILMFVAHVYDVNAQLSQAADYYKQARSVYLQPDTPKSPILYAAILNNLGTVQNRLEDVDDAIESLKGSIQALHGQHQEKLEAISNNNLGQFYLDAGRLDEADASFKQAQTIRKTKDFDPAGWATTRHNQGGLEAARRNFGTAKEFLREALDLRKGGNREFETLHLLGYVNNLEGNAQEALNIYLRVLPFVERRPPEKIITLLNIGGIQEKLSQTDDAWRSYKQAFDLLPLIDSPAIEWEVLFAVGRMEVARKELADAKKNLEKAYGLILKQSRRRINLNVRASYLATTRVVAETYVDALMRLAVEKKDTSLSERALEISERARARSLIDLLNEAKVPLYRDADPNLVERASAIEKQLNVADYVRQERRFNQAPPVMQNAAQKVVDDLAQQLETLETELRRSNRRLEDLLAPVPYTTAQLIKTLDSDTVALEFMLGEKQSYAWLVSSSGIVATHPLPPRSELERLARQYNEMMRNEDRKFADTGSTLTRLLLDPFAQEMRGKHLLIIPDGALYYLPFDALPITKRAGGSTRAVRYLVEETPTTVLPSLSTLLVQRETLKSSGSSDAVIVFADPVYDANDPPHACENMAPARRPPLSARTPNSFPAADVSRGQEALKLPRLFQSQKEMNAIIELRFNGRKVKACGFDAGVNRTTPESLGSFRFIHFAVHSTINTERPELSGLVLSLFDPNGRETPEGILHLNQIYRLKLQSELVALSACDTINGKEIKGEGIIGLTRGFMAAGAQRVMTSLWNINDKPLTVRLMKYFYEGVLDQKQRISPSVALQEAQKRLLREHPGLHPKYWAAFTIEGEYRPIANP